jgi:integrase
MRPIRGGRLYAMGRQPRGTGVGSALKVPGVKAERRRDTRGPAVEDIRRMLEATAGNTENGNPRRRDRRDALLARIAGLGAVRAEPRRNGSRAGHDVDPREGRRERELIPLPAAVVEALRRYLAQRGATGQGPLFVSRSRRSARDGSKRLHTNSVLRIVDGLGRRVGVRVWCHAPPHCDCCSTRVP